MRLQLIVAVALAASPASAEPGAQATMRVYVDDDDITVVSPSVRAGARLERFEVEVEATADAVSGASIDVVTAASPLPVAERRVEVGLAASRPVHPAGNLTLSTSLRGSYERDYAALRAGLGVRLEPFDRQVTVEARYLGGRDAITSVVDPAFGEDRTLHQLAATATVVLDRRTIVDVVGEGTRSSGYHASPYRRVPLTLADWPTPMWSAEQVPALRRTLAGAARLRRAFSERWFGTLGYRAYRDDWSITSHTATLEARWRLTERLLAGAVTRAYVQDGARFYRSSYDAAGEAPVWRTRDRTLGPMRTWFGSVTADVAVGDDQRWHVVVAAGVLTSWFLDFPLQSDRHALVMTVSLSTPLGGDE